MTDNSNRRVLFILLTVVLALVNAAPSRSKSSNGPKLVVNQRQKGEYNIRVNLKDFQFIALMGDGDGGDYEYSYDYADFTVKPTSGTSTTTTKSTTTPKASPTTSFPTSSTTIPTSTSTTAKSQPPYSYQTQKPLTSSIKPQEQPHPSETHSKPQKPIPTTEDSNSIENAVLINEPTLIKEPSSSSYTPSESSLSGSTSNKGSTDQPLAAMTPGKIKVQIMAESNDVPDKSQPSLPVHIVPGEELGEIEGAPIDDILKRCASGFTRDKKGRCRRVRRPGVSSQLPFGFSRFASNLASRLRLTPSQTSLNNSDLTELN